jgi:predicted transcriptional regulator
MILVRDILNDKIRVFNCVKPSTTVLEALHLMKAVNTSFVIVMEESLYKGVFCERDYARNIILRGRHSSNTEVQQVMTTDLPVVRTKNSLEECRKLLEVHKCNYLLAFDEDDVFRGVITIEDVIGLLVAEAEKAVVSKRQEMHLLDEFY